MSDLLTMGKAAKAAALVLGNLKTPEKNRVLFQAADALMARESEILAANKADVEAALEAGVKGALIDRLTLNSARIAGMADGLRQVARLKDPIGEYVSMTTLPNGLVVGKKRVPMGVIGIIFEARPNVTADAFGLCLKAGSATILRGGKEAYRSNTAIVSVFQDTLEEAGLPQGIVQMVGDTSRETATQMMRMNGYIDLLIPRGGAGLIQSVVQNATVPVIETGVGNCHIFVDATAKLEEALPILLNAKTQRPGVCNACETLLVHEAVAAAFLPKAVAALQEAGVECRGDAATQALAKVTPATDADYATEFLDLILAIHVVKDMDEAMRHIRTYGTGHSEAILTEDYSNAQRFLNEVDAAAVYVNASTRFTDGEQFGFGAEIGISTQKLHARGPMGLTELTTTKYIIYGNGQVRQ